MKYLITVQTYEPRDPAPVEAAGVEVNLPDGIYSEGWSGRWVLTPFCMVRVEPMPTTATTDHNTVTNL